MPSWRFVWLAAVCCVKLNSPVASAAAVAGAARAGGLKFRKIDGYPQHRWLIPGLTIDHAPQPSVLGNR